jgi:hypothetical protein
MLSDFILKFLKIILIVLAINTCDNVAVIQVTVLLIAFIMIIVISSTGLILL